MGLIVFMFFELAQMVIRRTVPFSFGYVDPCVCLIVAWGLLFVLYGQTEKCRYWGAGTALAAMVFLLLSWFNALGVTSVIISTIVVAIIVIATWKALQLTHI